MSFWPKLRKRSRVRKRSASVPRTNNPYASRDIDKYKVVHEELQAQRAQFASEKGVSIELVRFLSRSSRGWVHLSSETPSGATSPRASQDCSVALSPEVSHEFSLTLPPLPLPHGAPATAGSGDREEGGSPQGAESSSVGSGVMGLDCKGDSRNVGRLIVSWKLKDEAWLQISKTAAVLYVKVLVFSRVLGASTAFALTVAVVGDIWNRGRRTLHRVFSVLATQLLTLLKPYVSLQLSKPPTSLIRAAPRPAPQPSGPEQFSASNAMKVSPVTEDSNAQDSRSSSFAFPVLTKEPTSTSPLFPGRQRQADSPPEETSSSPSPLAESNKLPSAKPCHKLKSKLFKCSPARKGENSSPTAEISQLNDAPSSSSSSCNASPADGKGGKKKASCISRSPMNGGDEEYDEVDQPTSLLKPPKKITRSHELLFFRSPNHNRRREMIAAKVSSVPSAAVQNLSRSQELKFSLKNLARKKVSRSQEFITSSPPLPLQDLALPKSTVEGLEALAFPFKAEGVQQQERPSLPCSPRSSSSTKRRSSLSKGLSVESSYAKYSSRALESPRSSTASGGGSSKGGKSKTTASSSSTSVCSSKASAMLAAAELKPKLRKVRTGVSVPSGSEHHELRRVKTSVITSHPLPLQAGELGRSQVFSREILGSILLLAILASLLLGRIPAILCTSCLCLILSHLQRFFHKHLTPKDIELLKRSSGISRLHHTSSIPAHLSNGTFSNHGNPHDKFGLQSSEYRKRVLIEGLLDRGNRRGAIS